MSALYANQASDRSRLTFFEAHMLTMPNVLPDLHHRFTLLNLVPILQETRHLNLPDVFECRAESAEYLCRNIARRELATDMLESAKFER